MSFDKATVRQAQQAGVFYPADPVLLNRQIDDSLRSRYRNFTAAPEVVIKAVVAPHAGYDYSGNVAALAYAALRDQDWIERIVILAPNHQTPDRGGLICSHNTWMTPLGAVNIDRAFIEQHWSQLPQVANDDTVHQAEYSIEVQLPLIQQLVGDLPVVPMLLGECTAAEIAAILQPAWACEKTLIVISSDLYHYLPRDEALPTGMAIVRAIEQHDVSFIRPETACGYVALRGLMRLGRGAHYWRTLKVSHSGQSKRFAETSVVGYGAFLLCREPVCRLPV